MTNSRTEVTIMMRCREEKEFRRKQEESGDCSLDPKPEAAAQKQEEKKR